MSRAPLPPRVRVGERLGTRVVVGPAEPYRTKDGRTMRRWRMRCDCGLESETGEYQLVVKGAGCNGCVRVKHLAKATPEYNTWCGIIQRCTNPGATKYASYGGRGIRICNEWRHDFGAFLRHVGKRPGIGYTLERIDNNGHYEPGNVRWATAKEQARNTRNNHLVEFRGETKTIAEWCEITGVSYSAAMYRLSRGWDAERVFTQPVRRWPSQCR